MELAEDLESRVASALADFAAAKRLITQSQPAASSAAISVGLTGPFNTSIIKDQDQEMSYTVDSSEDEAALRAGGCDAHQARLRFDVVAGTALSKTQAAVERMNSLVQEMSQTSTEIGESLQQASGLSAELSDARKQRPKSDDVVGYVASPTKR